MCGLTRLHAYRNGVLNIVDVETKDARKKRTELAKEGWEVVYTEAI